jgi:hypothetical protein
VSGGDRDRDCLTRDPHGAFLYLDLGRAIGANRDHKTRAGYLYQRGGRFNLEVDSLALFGLDADLQPAPAVDQRNGILIVLALHLFHDDAGGLAHLHVAMLEESEQQRGVVAGGNLGAGAKLAGDGRGAGSRLYLLPGFRFRRFYVDLAADERSDGGLRLTRALPLLDRIDRNKQDQHGQGKEEGGLESAPRQGIAQRSTYLLPEPCTGAGRRLSYRLLQRDRLARLPERPDHGRPRGPGRRLPRFSRQRCCGRRKPA